MNSNSDNIVILDGKLCKKINKLQGMWDHFMYTHLEPIYKDWLFFYLILKFYITISVSINQEWLCLGWKFLLDIDENCDKIIYICSKMTKETFVIFFFKKCNYKINTIVLNFGQNSNLFFAINGFV